MLKTTLINSMVSFTLGTGATLVALASFTGSSNLNEIKQAVEQYTVQVEQNTTALMGDYNVVVENANAEIGEYQEALAQANSNIDSLITAYEQQEQQAEQELADLQAELDSMQQRLDTQYESDMNQVIEQANAEINQANQEVAETKTQVQEIIDASHLEDIINSERQQLDTTGDKTVTDISGIVGEQQGE